MMENITTHHAQVIDVLKKHFGTEVEVVGIEIGTRAGDLTKTILRECQNVRLYTVDPWIHDDSNLFEAGHPQEEHNIVMESAKVALAEFGERVTIMHMTSDQAYEQLDDFVDFVWIDGDHTIATVERDIENGLKRVRPGGILGGHDHNTVLGAINKKLAGRDIRRGADETWWIYV